MITVSGSLQEITGSAAASSNSYVRFWMRGTGGNQPFVSGTALLAPNGSTVWYADMVPDVGGNVSGNLYSTSEVSAGGQTGVIWYGMQVFQNGYGGPEAPVSAAGNININQPNILTNLPVVSAPTGDSTYARLDSTNQPFTGTVSAKGMAVAASGVFTNTQMNENNETIINSISPLTEFQKAQGLAHYGTDGLTGGVAVPGSSTVYQVNGVAGYVNSASATSNVVGGYFQARNVADNAKVWGMNSWATDDGHNSNTVIGYENDVNLTSTTTIGASILIDGIFGTDMPGYGAIHIARPQAKFGYGLNVDAGATSGGAINIYQTANTGTSLSSQPLNFWGMDSGGIGRFASINADANGNLLLTPNAASGVGIYAATGKSFVADAFQSSTANPASAGQLRLAHTDAVAFRNNANSNDVLFGINANDQLTAPAIDIATDKFIVNTSGILSTYNNKATAGPGVTAIYAVTSQKSETGADANVLTFTPAAVVGTYRITFVMSVSAANTATLGWTATWKDSNGNAQAPTNLSLFQEGTAAPALTFATSSPGNYYATAIVDIDNSATSIVVKTTFTGTSVAAKVSATIERII